MYKMIEKWLDCVLSKPIPENTEGFCINLYDDGDSQWSAEIVATHSFDNNNNDWGCDEITDFGTRNNPLIWSENSNWENVLERFKSSVMDYLSYGTYSAKLKAVKGIGLGFVDGELSILYKFNE